MKKLIIGILAVGFIFAFSHQSETMNNQSQDTPPPYAFSNMLR